MPSRVTRRLVAFAADYEQPLQAFLEGVGFAHEGTQREALFLHNARHDVHVYGLAIDQL